MLILSINKFLLRSVIAFTILSINTVITVNVYATKPELCDSKCYSQLQNYCPACDWTNFDKKTPWNENVPWWWGPDRVLYSNFFSPAVWSEHTPTVGINPNYYPGSGEVLVSNSHVYLQSYARQKENLQSISISSDKEKLSSVPIYRNNEWKFNLTENNTLRIHEATYDALISSYKINTAGLQDNAGFCSPRKTIIGDMALLLKKADFSDQEIIDFIKHWSMKFPISDKFCIYPQDEKALESIATLNAHPAPKFMRRVIFIAQTKDNFKNLSGKFEKQPQSIWMPTPQNELTQKSKFVVHEWGVGFLISK